MQDQPCESERKVNQNCNSLGSIDININISQNDKVKFVEEIEIAILHAEKTQFFLFEKMRDI